MEPKELNNKKDGWYDKRQPRYKWHYFKSLIFLFLAVNVDVVMPDISKNNTNNNNQSYSSHPEILIKQNQEIDNNIRQNPAQIPNIPAFYRQDIPALMARPANPFLN
ncbi:unnamed protein product [Cylicocyclus nassatus]|uniref:Uncharacterized protein n=1 Tax=Cylicocyclus nassatus TaxID=53992 RepID=A0AA36MBF9_CYLNA|nr:unnamed protein product [Cylicocyclus nassatus]